MKYIVFNDYWKNLNNDIEKEIKKLNFDIEIIHLKWKYKESFFLKVVRKILKKLDKIEWLLDLTEIKEKKFLDEDKVIYFDILEEEILKKITFYQTKGEKIFWLWNKLEEKEVLCIKKYFDNIWTFDKRDAIEYNLKIADQFYWRTKGKNLEPKYDFYFIGQNKGRIEKLIQLKNKLNNYKFKIEIILNPYLDILKYTINYNKYKNICQFKTKNYEDIIESINKSRCIIELTKKDQTGLTLRALEALFFRKKLITDNQDIKNYDFYNENNIYILENRENKITEDEKKRIEKFLNKEFIEISEKIKNKYTLENWLNKIAK